MLGAIERVLDVTSGKGIADLDDDPSLLESVLFNFIVIGEAARHIPEPIRQRAPAIPWLDVSGMRNVIAHGYFDVNIPILWRHHRRRPPSPDSRTPPPSRGRRPGRRCRS
jgi:uncharacterized protein with HEPN domain